MEAALERTFVRCAHRPDGRCLHIAQAELLADFAASTAGRETAGASRALIAQMLKSLDTSGDGRIDRALSPTRERPRVVIPHVENVMQ